MRSVPATGSFLREENRPNVVVSGGRGNGPRPEVNLTFVYVDPESELTYRHSAWFDSSDLIEAITSHSQPPYPANHPTRPLPGNVTPVGFSSRDPDPSPEGDIPA